MRIYRKSRSGKRANLPQGTPRTKVTHGASTSARTTWAITPSPLIDSVFDSTPVVGDEGNAKTALGEVVKPITRRGKPKTAQEWLVQNSGIVKRYRDKWIAISSEGICGISDDFDNVFEQAAAKGVSNPFVFKVPKADGDRKIVSVKRS